MTVQNKKPKRQHALKKATAKQADKNIKQATGENIQFTGKPADTSLNIELDPVITISETQSLYKQLQAHLDRGGDVTLDARQVHMIDTAGLQLLLAFVLELKNENRSINWRGVSPAFKETAGLLGLTELLGIH